MAAERSRLDREPRMPIAVALALLVTIPLAVVIVMLAVMLFVGIAFGPIWVTILR